MQDLTPSDEQLLERFRQPDTRESAFTQLMRKYQERLYWHVRKMVTFHEDADDVLQNTFVKVWKALDNFRGEAQLYTWLYRIATNEALAHIKQRQRKGADQSLDEEESTVSERLKADDYFNGDEVDRLLQEAIDALPDKQRAVFTMRYYDAMKYEDMAAILETSVGGLKANYHHAVKKVESYVKDRLNQAL